MNASITELNFVELDEQIELEVNHYAKQRSLPKKNANLVNLYTTQTAKNYNLANTNRDIDNCVELLTIAYNATPMKAGDIRKGISNIQQDLINAQRGCENTMKSTAKVAKSIHEDIEDEFADWIEQIESSDKKSYLQNEGFLAFIQDIKNSANEISKELSAISTQFDSISTKTLNVMTSSESLKGEEIANKEKIDQEIADHKAKEASLNSLLNSLEKSIKKYNDLANKFEAKADKADDRAFLTSMLQIGAQIVSSVASAFTMQQSGSANLINQVNASAKTDEAEPAKPADTGGKGKSEAQLKSAIAEQELALKKDKDKVSKLEKNVEKLTGEKTKDDEKSKKDDSQVDTVLSEQQKNQLKKAKSDLVAAQKSVSEKNDKLTELKNSLNKLTDVAKAITQEQRDDAAQFRKLQSEFLNKAQQYEDEKMKQDAAMVEIVALLNSKELHSSSIELTIKSLNLSIRSLKQSKKIVNEIAAFFSNFAMFLEQMAKDASKIADKTQKSRLSNATFSRIDKFFVSQYAKWMASKDMAERFNNAFYHGWTTLNNNAGNYLVDDELNAFLDNAKDRIKQIAKDRETASDNKLLQIDKYQQLLKSDLIKNAG